MKLFAKSPVVAITLLAGCYCATVRYESMSSEELVALVMDLKSPFRRSAESTILKPIYERFPVGTLKKNVADALCAMHQKHLYAVMIDGSLSEKKFGIIIFNFQKSAADASRRVRSSAVFSFRFDAEDLLQEITYYSLTSWW